MLKEGKFRIAAGAAAAVTAGAAAAYICRRRKKSAEDAGDAALAEGIARHAPLYNGLYEGIYQAVARDEFTDTAAYREWCGRTAHIEEDAEFARLFARSFDGKDSRDANGCGEKLKRLLRLIELAGIVRRDETELAVSAGTRTAYLYLGEGEPADGTVLTVMKPCWEYRGQTVEQGILMKKEG